MVNTDGILVGIVTEADLIRDAIPRDPSLVSPVMTKKGRTAARDTDCAEIAATMLNHHLRAVPVVQNREVVGIVTRRDLLHGLARDDALIRTDVQRNLDRYGGFEQWAISVLDGAVKITDPVGDPAGRDFARVLALASPGTRQVTVLEPKPQQAHA